MKKVQILGLTLCAVVTFSATVATSAFAEGELLFNGGKLGAEELSIEVAEELLLEDMEAVVKPDVVCSGIFDGHTSGTKLIVFTALLSLSKEELGNLIECTDEKKVCEGKVNVTVLNLPWQIEVELMMFFTFKYFLWFFSAGAGHVPSYAIDCKTLLGLVEDVCSGETMAIAENNASGLLMIFNSNTFSETEHQGAETPAITCTQSSGKNGLMESLHEGLEGGVVTAVGGGSLTVSG